VLGESFDEILEAARRGSDPAWDALYRDLAPLVHGYLRSRGAREPEDVTGEVFLQVARDLRVFSGDGASFRSWVLAVAHNRMLDEWRHHGRRPSHPASDEFIRDRAPTGDVEQEALHSLATERVRRLVEGLGSPQREVLMLRIIDGLTVNEVAQILGKPAGAVKALQRRGLAAVRGAMCREVAPALLT